MVGFFSAGRTESTAERSSRRTFRSKPTLLAASIAPFMSFFTGPYSELAQDPEVANFAVGNPQEVAMPAYVDALRAHLEPTDKDWFAYKMSEPNAQRTVAIAAERILPGATDANVAPFIEKMLAEWHTNEERARFVAGLEDLDVSRGTRFSHAVLAFEAAAEGHGVVVTMPVLGTRKKSPANHKFLSPCR